MPGSAVGFVRRVGYHTVTVLRRLGLAGLAGMAAAFIAAIVIAVADLYLTGHGYGSILKEAIRIPSLGVYLSVGDVVLLLAAVGAAWYTWRQLRRREGGDCAPPE